MPRKTEPTTPHFPDNEPTYEEIKEFERMLEEFKDEPYKFELLMVKLGYYTNATIREIEHNGRKFKKPEDYQVKGEAREIDGKTHWSVCEGLIESERRWEALKNLRRRKEYARKMEKEQLDTIIASEELGVPTGVEDNDKIKDSELPF